MSEQTSADGGKMDPELKQKWLDALRSGKYKQGEGQLRNVQDEFCCLGVLADIQGRRWRRHVALGGYDYGISCDGNTDFGGEDDPRLLAAIGNADRRKKLIVMNDSGKSFKQIAAYIQRYL